MKNNNSFKNLFSEILSVNITEVNDKSKIYNTAINLRKICFKRLFSYIFIPFALLFTIALITFSLDLYYFKFFLLILALIFDIWLITYIIYFAPLHIIRIIRLSRFINKNGSNLKYSDLL